ncbi:MAG: GMC family oxidoreductase N-terminal domain-containing protein [Pseudomonadota bacterium]
MAGQPDIIVVGAGSAGCALAARLVEAGLRVLILEAGGSDAHPLVKLPFGLVWLMGSRRDWALRSTPQAALDGRRISIPRGKMVGGSGSINSMVWFRGRRQDYADWALPNWSVDDVWRDFDQVEAHLTPARLPDPHPLSMALEAGFPEGARRPDPEQGSGGVFHTNMRHGRRWSAADAFLRPAVRTGRLTLRCHAPVDRIEIASGEARAVILTDGTRLEAAKGVVLSAGAVSSPAILMRSGLGPGAHLQALGIHVERDIPGIGANLHDHPAIALHHAGPGSGYGLEWGQLPAWALAPLIWALKRKGRLSSNTVEAGAFLRVSDDTGTPECQVHFLPAKLGWQGRAITWGAGYYADIGICQPRSRGTLRLATSNPHVPPEIDLNLLSHPDDMALLIRAVRRLRALLDDAPFGPRRAPEAFPGRDVQSDEALAAHIRARAGTAYHPVGTVAMGPDAPLDDTGALRGIGGLWVADASVMAKITSANTNAPAMMIGHRISGFIAHHITKGSSP